MVKKQYLSGRPATNRPRNTLRALALSLDQSSFLCQIPLRCKELIVVLLHILNYSITVITTSMKVLTAKQKTVLEFIGRYSLDRGFPPTLWEIGKGISLANISAVGGQLVALEKKGYITQEADKARSIRVVHSPSVFSRIKHHLHGIACTDKGVLHKVVYGAALTTRRHREYFMGGRRQWMDDALERRAIEHAWKFLRKQIKSDHIVLVAEVWPNHLSELVASRVRRAGNVLRLRQEQEFHSGSFCTRAMRPRPTSES